MYESFFSLQRRPFAAIPDVNCFHHSSSIQTVLDELVICLERGAGIAVLTAPPGLGKTLICQRVKEELSKGFTTIFLRHANFASPTALLQTILTELKVPIVGLSEQELRLQWEQALATIRSRKQMLVIICDESHHLDEPVLEELRTMTDLADQGIPWVRLLLAGQFELEEKLAAPAMSALNQRLRAHTNLSPLTTSESIDYIDFRITWAGGRTEEVFAPETLLAIAEAADGVPRCLNQLCDHVLLLAYVAEEKPAGVDLVSEALVDLKHLPLNWNIRSRRESDSEHFESSVPSSELDSTGPKFGEHLATWESSPTFDSHPADTSLPSSTVWEFGLDDESEHETPVSEDVSLEPVVEFAPKQTPIAFSAEQKSTTDDFLEEPVIDRYSAIDGGWWHDQLAVTPHEEACSTEKQTEQRIDPPTTRPATASILEWNRVPEQMPASVSPRIAPMTSPEPPSALPMLEQSLQSEVLELVVATQRAIRSAAVEHESDPLETSASFESDAFASPESPLRDAAENRPFRNLFTRLRRKQMGLE